MDPFPADQLDLTRLLDNREASRIRQEEYQVIVQALEPGDERVSWEKEAARVTKEIDELDILITKKQEFDRDQAAAN